MPTKQIASEQPLVEVAQANGDICHINLQSRHQQESHAGCTYDFDCGSIGTQDILCHLFLHCQPMNIHSFLYQQGDGHARVDHQEAFSGLTPRLVTPRDLPGSNADGEVWLVSRLLLGFAGSGHGLAALSLPVGIRTYLMTRALGALGRMLSRLASGIFGAADGDMTTDVIITCKTLSLTFFAMDTMVFWAAVGTLCTNSSSYSIACLVPSLVSLSVRLVIAKVS